MKKIYVLLLAVVVVSLSFSAFNDAGQQPSAVIKQRHGLRLNTFIASLQQFRDALQKADTNDNVEPLQQRFLEVRKAFKAWEYLGEYMDPQFVKDNINGAPLPKLERNTFGIVVMQPRGMQQIDDMLFGGTLAENKTELLAHTDKLLNALSDYKNLPSSIYDRIVFEAVRAEIVRIHTLGLTGFDVPGSGNSVNDAIIALQTIQQDLLLYKPLFEKTDKLNAGLFYTKLAESIEYLQQHNDFNTLDRLQFLTDFLNPMFSKILLLHKASGVEMLHETTQAFLLPPYNHQTDNLFANDFLNPFKYIGLPQELYTSELVELGRTLFYDPVLSSKNNRSCASCHNPTLAFTDGKEKSTALDFDGTVERNAPTLINCVYSERFFHDMRTEVLEAQIEHVLTNRKEFDTDMLAIIDKLKDSKEYVAMFDAGLKNYKGEKISAQGITFALSAYVTSLHGFNSAFDRYVRGEAKTVSVEVRRGYNLFMGKAVCGTCHFAPVFNGTVPPRYEESESEVLGVPANPYVEQPIIDPDLGRAKGMLKDNVYFYEYSFKTPTVRNIALTAPYMHNGSYKTMEDVLDFYNKGGGDGIGVKLEHQTLPFDSLSLNKQEIKDIIAFMKALTDTVNMTKKPARLPRFEKQTALNSRKIGGEY